jgi:predicted PurR-regulated permease PerM
MTIHTPLSDMSKPAATRVADFTATGFLCVCAGGLLLYFAHEAFIPIALALLFAVILSGPVEALHSARIPRSVGATVVLLGALVIMAGIVEVMWTPCQDWYAAAPQTIKLVQRKLVPATKFISHVEDLMNRASSVTTRPEARPVTTEPAGPLAVVDATRGALASILAFVIITLFLLAGGPPMLARMTAAFADDLNAAHALHVIEKVRAELGRFYVTTAMINAGLGCATAAAMHFCGMPTPYLWGFIAALLNFIPYAGPAATLVILILAAMLSDDTYGHIGLVAGSYLLLVCIEGQIVQPMLVGRRLEINPLLIFLALWFGGLYWGIAGIVLATPALVALKVVAENSVNGESLLEFLGPNQDSSGGRNLRERLERVFGGESG